MIAYVTIGTNDLARAAAFYDALLAEIGGRRFMEDELFIAWGTRQEAAGLAVTRPFNGCAATVGNGTMVALHAGSRAGVDRLYATAMALGAHDEGPPGQRNDGFYAAYFRDPDGNKFNVCYMGE